MGIYIVNRNGERALKFKGKILASVTKMTKYSIFGKKTEYTLYQTDGGKFVCQQVTSGLLSVKSMAIVINHIDNIDMFFGAKIAGELINKSGIEFYTWID